MKHTNTINKLVNDYALAKYFHDISNSIANIQNLERQLNNLCNQDKYLIDKYWRLNSDNRDIDARLNAYKEAQEHLDKLEAEGREGYFDIITNKLDCPEEQQGLFAWDKDGLFCYDWDSYSDWNEYGEIFAVAVSYSPENIEQSATYISLKSQIEQEKSKLDYTLEQLTLIGVTFNETI